MKWIPTSERLPSERGEYLVTVDFEGDTYVECFHYGKPIMANREVKDECFYDSDDEWGDVVYDTGTEVIAWMPLPEPYTADRKTEPFAKDINVRSKTEPSFKVDGIGDDDSTIHAIAHLQKVGWLQEHDRALTEPQTKEWHDDCNTCRWHACTIPCCDYEPKTESQTERSE